MGQEKTHAELRSAGTARELFAISEQMHEAMRQAREADECAGGSLGGSQQREPGTNFRPYDPDQRFFVDISRESFLEEHHPARIIDTVVEGLDLEDLYAQYSHEGNPAYHPKMMLKVLFYAYYLRVMSSRTIWDCVINRADFIYLAAGQVPNFRTINSFRLRHLKDLGTLFAQIVLLCKELGMVGFGHMAVDGQKIQANANFRKSKNLKGLKREYEKLKAGLQKLLEREVSEEVTQEKKDRRTGRLEKKLGRLEEIREQLEGFEEQDEEKRINMTDQDAPVMRHKDGTSKPSYNHQSAVDDRYGVTTAVRTTQESDRGEDVVAIVELSKQNSGASHTAVSADSGFCSYEILERIEGREEEFYLPDKRFEESKRDGRQKRCYGLEDFERDEHGTYTCPAGQPMRHLGRFDGPQGQRLDRYVGTACEGCELKARCTSADFRRLQVDAREPYRRAMREKLRSDKGRELYMRRQGVVEPGHGDDQRNGKWRQHHLRGLEKASAEFMLIRIASNLGKIIKFKSDELLAMQPA